MSTSRSEVARIRQQIELECQALWRMTHDPAIVASHTTITHKYQVLDSYANELAQFVGEDEATEMTAKIYVEIVG